MGRALPQYRKLHLELREKIVSGDISEGALLPSENELSASYNITRATVRQGLEELVKEGFIEKRMGIGSVVIQNRRALGLLNFKGFSEVLGTTSLRTTTQNLELSEFSDWPSPFFYRLSPIEEASGHFFLKRLRSVEGHPVMLEFTYVPKVGLPHFLQHLENKSLFKTLQHEYRIEVLQVLQDIRAIPATPELGLHLDLVPGAPLVHIHRKYRTNKTDFHIYSGLYCNTEKYALSNFFN